MNLKNMIQKLNKILMSKVAIGIYATLSLLWGAELINTDAYYINYILILVLAGICFYSNLKNGELSRSQTRPKSEVLFVRILSILFTFMIAIANYRMWSIQINYSIEGVFDYINFTYAIPGVQFFFMLMVFFGGGYFAFWNIFTFISVNLNRFIWNRKEDNYNSRDVFVISFVILLLTRCIILFLSQYPGEVTPDSVNQIKQIMKGAYTNHHPFYHTMVIKACMSLGMFLFNDINAAAATYSVFQILFTSMCFSYLLSTLSYMKVPKIIIKLSAAFLILMPYHIIYSFTMWKDIMFACFVLLFVAGMFRFLNDIGNRTANYVTIAVSSIGTCLFRSNGLFVFILVAILFWKLWGFKYKKIIIILTSAIVISFIMKYGVLTLLNVPQPDITESLSAPLQQMARLQYDGHELTTEERDGIGEIMEMEMNFSMYMPYISDNVKSAVKDQNGLKNLMANPLKYIQLYILLGLKYPGTYGAAWIDLTRGYWNAGYEYPRWQIEVSYNDYEIKHEIKNETANNMFLIYLWEYTHIEALKLFMSIGLFVWIDIILFGISLFRKDKLGIFMSFPVLSIVISLLLTAPVFAEFRYIYAAFCIIPLVLAVVLRPSDKFMEA